MEAFIIGLEHILSESPKVIAEVAALWAVVKPLFSGLTAEQIARVEAAIENARSAL